MEKTILIAGKDIPDGLDFADGALMTGRNVVATVSDKANAKQAADGETVTVLWNKTSPVSARALVLECENYFKHLDEAVLYFDEAYFAQKFEGITLENCTQVIDEAVVGFEYLTQEILSRFEKRFAFEYVQDEKIKPAKLVFVLKGSPDEADVLKNSAVRNSAANIAGPFVAAAAAAFEAFAENIAAVYGGRDYVSVVLVRGDASVELCKSDRNFTSWLCSYMDEVDNLKHKLNAKQCASWVKAGTKSPGGFGFLK
ncbi:MAG: hypothetical protein J6X37_06030 [Treponema sp.]|uniref:hypothetical protein n=1 Tax=Treponema sp. TaxID=166 RepID=UPI001B6AC1E4|nr:hypothetical protein [Treponema sp.]MBP5588269.1 hypothetical protein [Treponema sp.]MBR0155460.1 hypothetical protein [Treponema sp.]